MSLNILIGLLLRGDKDVQLVVLCAEKPTTTLLRRVAQELPIQLKTITEEFKYTVTLAVTESAVNVTDGIVTVKVSLTSPLLREQGKCTNRLYLQDTWFRYGFEQPVSYTINFHDNSIDFRIAFVLGKFYIMNFLIAIISYLINNKWQWNWCFEVRYKPEIWSDNRKTCEGLFYSKWQSL